MVAIVTIPADGGVVEAPLLGFEIVQARPELKRTHIPKLIYAMVLLLLRSFCHDHNWNRLADKISAQKFNLFPELRRWQINKWVAQFRRQNLFPNATESELQAWAKDLVMGFLL